MHSIWGAIEPARLWQTSYSNDREDLRSIIV